MKPKDENHKQLLSHLAAAEGALKHAQKPLTSRQIVELIIQLGLSHISGATPYKTINARISEDISQKGTSSVFVRTAQGRFSLRGSGWEPEITVKARSIAPLEEDIRVVTREQLLQLLRPKPGHKLYSVDRTLLVSVGKTLRRSEAEERTDVVQLIPSFVVRKRNKVLSFIRTKRLPEARLHNSKSVNFGGHLQSDDFPELFAQNQTVVDLFLARELNEELFFSRKPNLAFIGALYMQSTPFERQHVGLVYSAIADEETEIKSIEPGYHTNLQFEDIHTLITHNENLDSWSKLLVEEAFKQDVW